MTWLLVALWAIAGMPPATSGSDWLTTATVLDEEVVFHSEFEPPQGTGGLTLPDRGVDLVRRGDRWMVRLAPERRRSLTCWVALPAVAWDKHLRVKLVGAAEETATLQLAGVAGSRPVGSASALSRHEVALGPDLREATCLLRMGYGADTLAVGLPAGSSPALLASLQIIVEHRQRDALVAERAGRGGNLIENGGFELGAAGWTCTATDPSFAPDGGVLPGNLKVYRRGANEGLRAAQVVVPGGTVKLAPRPAVLPSDTACTLALDARAFAGANGRLRLTLQDAGGRPHGRIEAALDGEWRRFTTTVTTPPGLPGAWLPVIEVLSADDSYVALLDAVSLSADEVGAYRGKGTPEVAIEVESDGYAPPAGVVSADQTVTINAIAAAGSDALAGGLTVWDVPLTGSPTALGDGRLRLSAGAQAGVVLRDLRLEPGWHRLRVELTPERGLPVTAETRLAVAPAGQRRVAEGWDLTVDWSIPDSVIPARTREDVLEALPALGVTTRWLRSNIAAWWAAFEPQPGRLTIGPVLTLLAAGSDVGLGTVVALEPFPPVAQAPPWLVGRSRRAGDRLVPEAEVWERLLTMLAGAMRERPAKFALTPPPRGLESEWRAARAVAERVFAAEAPAIWLPDEAQHAGRWLSAVSGGSLDPSYLSWRNAGPETDPVVVEAGRCRALAVAVASGARTLHLPGQGWWPADHDQPTMPGLVDPAGGPRPVVAAWLYLNHALGERQVQRVVTTEGGPAAALFGEVEPVMLLWSDGEPRVVPVPPTAQVRLVTGEVLPVPPAGGETVALCDRWPVLVGGLSPAEAEAVLAAVGAP